MFGATEKHVQLTNNYNFLFQVLLFLDLLLSSLRCLHNDNIYILKLVTDMLVLKLSWAL